MIPFETRDGIVQEKPETWLKLDTQDSYLDSRYADMPAQYSTPDGHPGKPWDDVTKTLKELDTRMSTLSVHRTTRSSSISISLKGIQVS